jgi:hypothetical protein
MKLKITPENIVFDYLFYSVIIPKSKEISYNFTSEDTYDIGFPPAMSIVSQKQIINYKIKIIGQLIYWLENIASSLDYKTSAFRAVFPNWRTTIKSKSFSRDASLGKIKETLQSLKSNGYEVSAAEAELQKIITAGLNKKLQEGTVQWKKDKLKLFRNIILVVAGMFAIFYFRGDFNRDDKFIIVPIFVFGIIILISLIVIFSKNKNIIWKLLLATILFLILGKIIDIFYTKQ